MNSKIQELEKDGWTQRFVACDPRLSEAVEIYKASGFDVRLEPLSKGADCLDWAGQEGQGECRVCYEGEEDRYRIIFTRPSGRSGPTFQST
ncbi:MAG: hypothetical protein ABIG67_09205 [Pseudomonadota bacterium]